jgi:hypothetical protein
MTNTDYYQIVDAHDTEITNGIQTETEARRIALRHASARGESVYLWSPGASEATEIAPYVASLADALAWARWADAGEYLVSYEETGMTDVEDPGSRCGYSDDGLDEISRVLGQRGLTLTADDCGLVAQAVRS